RGEPVPDAVRALWKHELCLLLELGALSRSDVEALLAEVLAGPLDGTSAHALFELTKGNALFLRELVRHGLDHALLVDEGGIWRWGGELRAGTRLAELVDLRVGDAGPEARELLELVAVGAPLETGLLADGDRSALEPLERADLVQRRSEGRRRYVDV